MSHSFFDNVCSHWYFGFIFFISRMAPLNMAEKYHEVSGIFVFFVWRISVHASIWWSVGKWRTESISLVFVQQGSIYGTLYVEVVFRWNTFLNDLRTSTINYVPTIIINFGNKTKTHSKFWELIFISITW